MGRGKTVETKAAQAGQEPVEEASSLACGICGEAIDQEEEEFLRCHCNKCNQCDIHFECGVDFLIARASEKSNSIAVSKYKVKARKNPAQLFSIGIACPNGIFNLSNWDGVKQPGSQSFRGKHAVTGACSGHVTEAEVVKPVKQPPVPLPQSLPARAPKEKKDKEKDKKEAKAQDAPPKRTSSAASSTSPSSHLSPATSANKVRAALGVPAPGSGASVRLMGASHSPWTTVGSGGGGSFKKAGVPGAVPQPDRLRLPPGVSRPPELTLCKHFLESGKCYLYRCEFAHSEEELRQREKAWMVRQETKKREAQQREAAAHAAAVARLEEEQELMAQLASMESLYDPQPPAFPQRSTTATSARSTASTYSASVAAPTPAARPPSSVAAEPLVDGGLHLTDHSLFLMRSFKRSLCRNSLLEMGFTASQAGAAADAAAGDLERAAQMLMDGQHCAGAMPVDVKREAEELASIAVALGVSADVVEGYLVQTGGNWEAAMEALQVPPSASGSGRNFAAPEQDLTSWARPEPDTPSISGPGAPAAWAADASSSFSALSTESQSPRTAAALAAVTAADLFPAPAPVPVAAPGVLSLADFASDGDGSNMDGVARLEHLMGAAPLPTPAEVIPVAAGAIPDSGVGYSDGYAAGLAAAVALYGQHLAAQPQAQPQSVYAASAVDAGWGLPALVPAPRVQAESPEEDLDSLLHMLGVN